MAVTTSFEFHTLRTFTDAFAFTDPAMGSVDGGYVYGGFSTMFGNTTLPVQTNSPGNFAAQTGTNMNLAGLLGDKYVAVTQDADSIRYQIFTVGGTEVTASIDIGDTGSTNADVAGLKNGGFVIASQDFFSGTDSDIDLYFYNSSGGLVVGFTPDSSLANDRDASVAVLDNGNVAVGWVRTVGSETEVWAAIYTETGSQVMGPTLIDTSNPTNDKVELVSTPGGFAMAYLSAREDVGKDLKIITLTSSGTALLGAQLTEFGELTDLSITRLSSGMLVANFRDDFENSAYALIDPATLAVRVETEWEGSFGIDSFGSQLAAFGDDRFAIITPITSEIGAFAPTAQISEVAAFRRMQGDAANDTITADNSMAHHLRGEGGTDRLTGSIHDDLLDGGLGNDTLDGKGGDDELRGGAGNDSYLVDSQFDVIVEDVNAGTDKVTSTAFAYELSANVENLTLGVGAVEGYGNSGNNTLTGNSANNYLFGGAGKDRLDGKAGADTMAGGDGDDTYFVDNAGDVVIEEAGATAGTRDTVNVGAGFGSASYFLGANVENGILTSNTQQALVGNELNNALTARSSSEMQRLSGEEGNDTLTGSNAGNRLTGGAGKDTLTGGGGSDFFDFDVLETSANRDTIRDFSQAQQDVIRIFAGAFTGLEDYVSSYLAAADFRLGTAAGDASDRIIYDQATGNLWYDADGTGASAQVHVAVLSNKPVLLAEDIFII